jgi:hypothetical protein
MRNAGEIDYMDHYSSKLPYVILERTDQLAEIPTPDVSTDRTIRGTVCDGAKEVRPVARPPA